MDSAASAFSKVILIDLLILFYCWKLANYKGIPVMLVWVLGILLLYAFITSKTAFGRYFYAVGRQREGHQALRHRHPEGLLRRLLLHVRTGWSVLGFCWSAALGLVPSNGD